MRILRTNSLLHYNHHKFFAYFLAYLELFNNEVDEHYMMIIAVMSEKFG